MFWVSGFLGFLGCTGFPGLYGVSYKNWLFSRCFRAVSGVGVLLFSYFLFYYCWLLVLGVVLVLPIIIWVLIFGFYFVLFIGYLILLLFLSFTILSAFWDSVVRCFGVLCRC